MTDSTQPNGVQVYASSANAGFADKVALALHRAGYEIVNGEFDPDTVKAVVLLWSGYSIASKSLRAAALDPLAHGALAPVSIGKIEPPAPFKDLTPMNLAGWRGDDDDPRWRFVLEEIEAIGQRRAEETPPSSTVPAAEDEQSTAPPPAALEDDIGAAPPLSAQRSDADGAAEILGDLDADPETAVDADDDRVRARALRSNPLPAPVALAGLAGFVVALTAGGLLLGNFMRPPAPPAETAPIVIAENRSEAVPAPARPERRMTRQAESPMTAAAAAAEPGGSDAFSPDEEPAPDQASADAETEASVDETDLLDDADTAEATPAEKRSPITADDATMLASLMNGADTDGNDPATALSEEPASDNEASSDGAPGGLTIEEILVNEGVVDEALLPQGDASTDEGIPDPNPDQLASLISEVAEPVAPRAYTGDFFKECVACPEMRALPAGSFVFGAPRGELARTDAERPARPVDIEKPFAIGSREVTYEQWDACVADGGCRAYSPPANWGRGRQPVVNVSYEDAQSYVRWLSEKTGANYRLPTEKEWEFAARAGTQTAFSFGNAVTPDIANYNGEFPYRGPEGTFRGRTTPVGAFAPNRYGLFDMHGNVWEWTDDCWSETHAAEPQGGDNCPNRVIKGGAWNSGGWRLRAAHRLPTRADAREHDKGFRVARDLE